MRFETTALDGVWIIDVERREDERGFFARTFCTDELAARGLASQLAQSSISFNLRSGTLRGMHWQAAPHAEHKLVRCTMGRIYDVALDLRPDSPTYTRWIGVELSEDNRRQLYIPPGVAHGFLTLEDATEVAYQISERYVPAFARGVRWDDPAFAIQWPVAPVVISERDRTYPAFRGASS